MAKSCFISASAAALPHLESLRNLLRQKGVQITVPSDLKPGLAWPDLLHDTLRRVDFVIAVVTGEADNNNNVYYEAGLAHGLNKRVLFLVEPSVSDVPSDLQGMLSLRVALTNTDAISFALEQLLSAPAKRHRPSTSTHKYAPLGSHVDTLLKELDHLEETDSSDRFEAHLEALVEKALQQSGVTTIVRSYAEQDRRFDLALWVDELESYVGNPFIIEIKRSIKDPVVIRKLADLLVETSARWALLLYLHGPQSETFPGDVLPPNILRLPIREFLESMRSKSFPVIVRDLRNRRVHGVGA